MRVAVLQVAYGEGAEEAVEAEEQAQVAYALRLLAIAAPAGWFADRTGTTNESTEAAQ